MGYLRSGAWRLCSEFSQIHIPINSKLVIAVCCDCAKSLGHHHDRFVGLCVIRPGRRIVSPVPRVAHPTNRKREATARHDLDLREIMTGRLCHGDAQTLRDLGHARGHVTASADRRGEHQFEALELVIGFL
jgi:hypothetical protein